MKTEKTKSKKNSDLGFPNQSATEVKQKKPKLSTN